MKVVDYLNMNTEDKQELFDFLEKRDVINHERFLTAMEIQLADVKEMVKDEINRVETKIDNLEKRFDGLEQRFDGLEKTVNFIKDFLMNNLVPRIEKLEAGYQYLLKLVTSK